MSLFDDVKAAGIPYHNHYSDLYIPATPETAALLRKWKDTYVHPHYFTNQVEGGLWYDIPFAYDPFWQAVEQKKANVMFGART